MTMHEAKKYLKNFNNIQLENLFKKSNLTETEYWLLRYALIQKRMVENICMKLNISRSTYRNMYNIALTKVDFTLNNLLMPKD